MDTRIEQDTMGGIAVPGEALYGAQTARAVDNFPISGQGIGRGMIRSLGLVKLAAALVNRDLGQLDTRLAAAITVAAQEVVQGHLDEHFPVDVFQTGSGTSSNMNANEVIANRANQLLGGTVGGKSPVHPNDHVNLGQSSNDVFPSAIHLATLAAIEKDLLPALWRLHDALHEKSEAFADAAKLGRTHLQDATPMTLGQEFSGFASQLEHGIRHLATVADDLRELALGGTAVGTGLNTHPEFGRRMAERLSCLAGTVFVEADNHFEAQSARDAAVRASGALRSLAVSLIKIANDIRWLGSGPRHGLGELILPAVQPGSSIMPGKVNPVIAEAMIQAAAQVIGNDAAIAAGGMFGQFQLNAMQPLIARNLLEQVRLLARGAAVFTDKLVVGLEVNRDRLGSQAGDTVALATSLAPRIGYERAAAVEKRARSEGLSVREIVRREGILSREELEALSDPEIGNDQVP